jgi:hypothetical protein
METLGGKRGHGLLLSFDRNLEVLLQDGRLLILFYFSSTMTASMTKDWQERPE